MTPTQAHMKLEALRLCPLGPMPVRAHGYKVPSQPVRRSWSKEKP